MDPDTPREELLFQVAYSFDGGDSFVPIAVDQQNTEFEFDVRQIPPSRGTGLIRVFVSDGLNTSFADVGNLSVGSICAGDCNGDGATTIDELVVLVNIALGGPTTDTCRSGDRNGDGRISISELVAAVRSVLTSCA